MQNGGEIVPSIEGSISQNTKKKNLGAFLLLLLLGTY
jgi:hypothetical protein